MADYLLVCRGIIVLTNNTPQCQGEWITSLFSPPVSTADIDPLIVAEAIGSGFIIAGTPLIFILCARLILSSIKGNRYEN